MNKYFLIILIAILFSCKKENSLEPNKDIASELYHKAKICRESNVSDSAFIYYYLAKNSYLELNDSLGIGKSLVNMSILQESRGDYYGSIENSIEANRYLENKKDSISKQTLASNFNSMAICSSYLYSFDDAIKYYKDAIKYSNNVENKYMYYNNLGAVLITMGKYKEAQKNIKYALNTTDSLTYAKVINNWARAKYYDNQNYDPLPEFYKSLKIRQKSEKTEEENSSYATLSTYFLPLDKKIALEYAKKMLNTAKRSNSSEDQLQALQKIINLDTENYLDYFKEFQTLNDSVQISRNKAKNQFATIRYDVEKSKNENQKLKLQDAEKEVDILKRNIGLGILSILLIGGFFWNKKRKKRLQQENELKIKNNQLKLSKKVHDVVANGIYQVITKIENQENIDKNEMLDELEFVYEKSRDISYEKIDSQEKEEDFSKKISKLIATFKNETVNTYVAGNDETIWKDMKPSDQEEVYQIIRELLVNMKKHSQADRVVLKFERINNFITIHYTDNGVGVSGKLIYKNGLTSTGSRIDSIGGEITFDTKTEKGLKINISFPVS